MLFKKTILFTQALLLALVPIWSPVYAMPNDVSSESIKQSKKVFTAIAQLSKSEKTASMSGVLKDSRGRSIKIDVTRAVGKEDINKELDRLNSSATEYSEASKELISFVNETDPEEIKNISKLHKNWRAAGYSKVQQIAVIKDLKKLYEKNKYNNVGKALYSYHRITLTTLRLVGYFGIITYTFSSVMPMLPSIWSGVIAATAGAAITGLQGNVNNWLTYKGWGTFTEKQIKKDEKGNKVQARFVESSAKWLSMQVAVLSLIEAVKYYYASGMYPEMLESGVLRTFTDVMWISFVAFLQQGTWEIVIAEFSKEKEKRIIDKFNKAKERGEDVSPFRLARDIHLQTVKERTFGFGLAFISIAFASVAMSGDMKSTLLAMSAFGAPAIVILLNKNEKKLSAQLTCIHQSFKGAWGQSSPMCSSVFSTGL